MVDLKVHFAFLVCFINLWQRATSPEQLLLNVLQYQAKVQCRSSQQTCSVKKKKNFINFTTKHLRWSLFFNKVAGLRLILIKLQVYFEDDLRRTASISVNSNNLGNGSKELCCNYSNF